MSLTTILIIIFIHWVADFIFQDEKWALNKSKNNTDLFFHVLTYSTIWLFASCLLLGYVRRNETTEWYVYSSMLFFLMTFSCHFITDYITSRIVSKKFANKEYGSSIPNFGGFTVIGFDQFLHYAQLFITFYLLTSGK
jgi:hypothetical protein